MNRVQVQWALARLPKRLEWVLRPAPLKPWDHGEPGGPVEMTRMMYFEFADGTGVSEWSVDPNWQPPPLP